jgi:hypothetical protein
VWSNQNARYYHVGVFGVRSAQLYDHAQQEKAAGEARAEKVLSALPQAHAAQRNKIRAAWQ